MKVSDKIKLSRSPGWNHLVRVWIRKTKLFLFQPLADAAGPTRRKRPRYPNSINPVFCCAFKNFKNVIPAIAVSTVLYRYIEPPPPTPRGGVLGCVAERIGDRRRSIFTIIRLCACCCCVPRLTDLLLPPQGGDKDELVKQQSIIRAREGACDLFLDF